jgi:hypothetical protein
MYPRSLGKPTLIAVRSLMEAFKICSSAFYLVAAWAFVDILLINKYNKFKFQIHMGKKGLSLDEKRQKILEIYYEKV